MYDGKLKFLTVFSCTERITLIGIFLWNLKYLHSTFFFRRFLSQSKMAHFSVVFQNPVLIGEFKFSNYGVVFPWDPNVTLEGHCWEGVGMLPSSALICNSQRSKRRRPGVCAPRTVFR